ncbi:uncharacterized protein ACDP82_015716 [Pangshura tecta]
MQPSLSLPVPTCVQLLPAPEVAASPHQARGPRHSSPPIGRNHSALEFAGPEVTAEAGSAVSLPCTLTGPRLSWRWVPRCPRCAGGSSGIQTIYTATAAGEHDAQEGRFQKRLRLLRDQGNRTSVLELRPLHMSDLGAFFCASPSQDAPPISVTVTPAARSKAPPQRQLPPEAPLPGSAPSSTMRPQLLPLALALLAALPLGAQAGRNHSALEFAGPEVTAEAGSAVSLPCTLTGPRLSWRWVPRYPRCAGGSSGIQTIYTAIAAGAHDAPEGRFQKRLRLLRDQGNRTSVLELQPLHMNDSGAFFCASPSQDGPPISVTVTPGCPAGASITAVPQEPVVEGVSVSLSCTPCGAQGPTSPPAGGATWRLNGKLLPDSAALRLLRAKVTIDGFSSRWEGLWSCHLPGAPHRSGGYCLERHPGVHRTQESPPPSSTPVSPGSAPGSGRGVTVLAVRWGLAFLFLSASLGALGYVHWRTRARPPSRPQQN